MLSVFPELFNYSQIAPLIFRIALAVILIRIGYKNGLIGIVQILTAVLLFLGLFTQIAGLLAIGACYKIKERKLMLLIFAIAVSLMLLGPGLFSIDLPL
ncbi:MAG: hypothetical protein NTX55_00865 [Candidatus Parcubacteria bacterium]|nr:hypothetical protein [Candidatus Parcubacteria bacterium]